MAFVTLLFFPCGILFGHWTLFSSFSFCACVQNGSEQRVTSVGRMVFCWLRSSQTKPRPGGLVEAARGNAPKTPKALRGASSCSLDKLKWESSDKFKFIWFWKLL
jgi:hypothetical protein